MPVYYMKIFCYYKISSSVDHFHSSWVLIIKSSWVLIAGVLIPGACKHLTRRKKMKPEHFLWQQVSVQEAGDTHWNTEGCLWASRIVFFFIMKLVEHRPGLLRDAVDLLQRNAKCNWTWQPSRMWRMRGVKVFLLSGRKVTKPKVLP